MNHSILSGSTPPTPWPVPSACIGRLKTCYTKRRVTNKSRMCFDSGGGGVGLEPHTTANKIMGLFHSIPSYTINPLDSKADHDAFPLHAGRSKDLCFWLEEQEIQVHPLPSLTPISQLFTSTPRGVLDYSLFNPLYTTVKCSASFDQQLAGRVEKNILLAKMYEIGENFPLTFCAN